MSELNLLIECINTEGEAEDGGIKYIYMDADTIYRFENNRMKKISKTLINKAMKQIQSQNTINQLNQQSQTNSNLLDEKKNLPTRSVKSKKNRSIPVVEQPLNEYDYDDSDNEENEPDSALQQTVKRSKKLSKQPKTKRLLADFSPNINLDEYYNNKNKMEYMNLEITRLNNKVDKLKQYKAIVNKLTGNEFDFDISEARSPQTASYQQLPNTSTFSASNAVRNDSLFLY